MTDPQNDVKCRDCGAPTQHATEICGDCRTPAGRLVTALAAIGINATANKRGIVRVKDHTFVCEPGDASVPWVISDAAETLDEATEAAADAIAAIVQAPGLRAENEVLTNDLGHYMAEAHQRTEERDTLAAEVKRLREELEKPIASGWHLGRSWQRTEATPSSRWKRVDLALMGLIAEAQDDAGRNEEDLRLLAAGYRLVGGAHPLPVAAECKHKWKNVPFSATGPDSDDGRDGPVCSICGEEWEVDDG